VGLWWGCVLTERPVNEGGGDGVPEVPEVQHRPLNSAVGLRARGSFRPFQSVGMHQSGVWFFAASRQGRSQLREEDRAQALVMRR